MWGCAVQWKQQQRCVSENCSAWQWTMGEENTGFVSGGGNGAAAFQKSGARDCMCAGRGSGRELGVSSHSQKLGAKERQTDWHSSRAVKILSFLLEFKGINTVRNITPLCKSLCCTIKSSAFFYSYWFLLYLLESQWTNFFLSCVTFYFSFSQNTFSVRYGLHSIIPRGNGESSTNCNKIWTQSYREEYLANGVCEQKAKGRLLQSLYSVAYLLLTSGTHTCIQS